MAEIENKHMKVKGMPPLVVDDAVMIAHEIHKVHEAIGDISINAEITTETGDIAQDTTMQAINLTLETLVSGLAVLTQAVQSLDNEAEIEEIRAQIATIAGEIEDLTELSHTLGKDVLEIRSAIAYTDETVEDLSTQLSTLDELLESLREWAQTSEGRLQEVEESVAGIDSEITEINSEITEIKEEIAALTPGSGSDGVQVVNNTLTITGTFSPIPTDRWYANQCYSEFFNEHFLGFEDLGLEATDVTILSVIAMIGDVTLALTTEPATGYSMRIPGGSPSFVANAFYNAHSSATEWVLDVRGRLYSNDAVSGLSGTITATYTINLTTIYKNNDTDTDQ